MGEAWTSRIAGMVLAGGQARRMGRDKALLRVGGVRLVDLAMARLGVALPGAPLWVSGPGRGHPEVLDLMPGQGPVGGICSGLEAAVRVGARGVLFVPVDMPGLGADVLRSLVAAWRGEPAIAFAGHEVPLLVSTERAVRAQVAELCGPGVDPRARSIHGLLDRLGAARPGAVDVAPEAFVNLNTPEQLAAWQREVRP